MAPASIGYARPSGEEGIEPQRIALLGAGCDPIFVEKTAPKALAWRQLGKALRSLEAGQTLVVDRLDRLGHNLVDIVAIAQRVLKAGAGLRALDPPFDTTEPAARQIIEAMIAAQHQLVSARAKSGIDNRRAAGKSLGPPTRLKPDQWPELRALIAEKTSVAKMVEHFGVSRQTLWNFRRRMETADDQPSGASAKS